MKKPITLRFDMELYEILREKAKTENRSITNLIETVMWMWVRSH